MTRCLSGDDEKLSSRASARSASAVTTSEGGLRPEMDAVASSVACWRFCGPKASGARPLRTARPRIRGERAPKLKAGMGVRRFAGFQCPLQAPARRQGRDSPEPRKGADRGPAQRRDFFLRAIWISSSKAQRLPVRPDSGARRWRTRRGTGASTRSGWTNCFFACSRSTRRPPVPLRFPVHLRGGICARFTPPEFTILLILLDEFHTVAW